MGEGDFVTLHKIKKHELKKTQNISDHPSVLLRMN